MVTSINTPTINLAKTLIERPSVSPLDLGCQDLIIDRLTPLGFIAEKMRFIDTDNLWLRKGVDEPVFAFIGHTDVVPPGPETQWDTPPFNPTVRQNHLYGRGAADMKGSIAAMITALERFLQKNKHHSGSIALLITSDEEAACINGTIRVVEVLEKRGEKIDWCLVGEPSSDQQVGDVIKHGRRGSLHCCLNIQGIQGHIAYPHLAQNPIHQVGPVITTLVSEIWDRGNSFFPPTSFQISNIHSGTGSNNVIPGELEIQANFRFSPKVTPLFLQQKTNALLKKHDNLHYQLNWQLSGMPFFTIDGPLLQATLESIKEITGLHAKLSTAGGTSDGRYLAPTGAQIIELGPCNATIHKVNECVSIEDLNFLSKIYERILEKLLPNNAKFKHNSLL